MTSRNARTKRNFHLDFLEERNAPSAIGGVAAEVAAPHSTPDKAAHHPSHKPTHHHTPSHKK